MEDIIKEIEIPDERYYIRIEEVPETENSENQVQRLKNLSKINIIIGENNSGKSRLLRSFIINKELKFLPYNPTLPILNEIIAFLKDRLIEFSTTLPHSSRMKSEIEEHSLKLMEIKILKNGEDPLDVLSDFRSFIENLKKQSNTAVSRGGQTYPQVANILELTLNDTFEKFNLSLDETNLKYKFQKIYIPILRGLRPFKNGDVYRTRTENDYFSRKSVGDGVGIDGSRVTFTGLDIYNQIKIHLLGKLEQRNLIKEYQDFLSERFFENEEITLIPDLDEDGILRIKIGDEKEKEIYNLGDGIQSIIIMTFPLFLYLDKEELKDSNLLFFIEEPEHLLHPGLQRKLMDTFHDERFKDYQFFVTTHSNHFLDITLDYDDVSIFYLRKELGDDEGVEKTPYFSIEPLSYGDTNVLELLGVRNTSVFLSNCTIWIEGVTDRKYIRKYFEIYQTYLKKKFEDYLKENPDEKEKLDFIEFREDYNFSFVEYSGNNITHWSFLDDESELKDGERINVERLCGKLFLIVDRDKLKKDKDDEIPEKVKRFEKLQKKLSKRFYLMDCKEIENTLSKNTIAEVVRDYEKYFKADEEVFKQIDVFLEDDTFDEDSYKDDSIGKFIEETILKNKHKRKSYIEGNTIKDKTNFCKKALNHINRYEDLSEKALDICNSLYQFVAYGNGYQRSYLENCQKMGIINEIIDYEKLKESKPIIVEEKTSKG